VRVEETRAKVDSWQKATTIGMPRRQRRTGRIGIWKALVMFEMVSDNGPNQRFWRHGLVGLLDVGEQV